MHWFESQLTALDQLAADYLNSQRQTSEDIIRTSEDLRIKRRRFIDALQKLVDNIMEIKGISACAAYHEGLVLVSSGRMPNIDALGALGAMIQESVGVARKGAAILNLGDIEQILIIGSTDKVAMLNVGPIVLCIACPKGVNLASALSRRK
ncbi:roadblock/LC7 domain-containing protein [Methylomarinum sp. Ch1-1]|uniref:Roadblock/LC7 domain-containing protein n=1 Tax=Methylomarinum roseum TaxID=3067653 RepID=A0AAU7NQF0_9GAMM|nr:roadblock/LC7 domain-containing protein [Methylomarinum sp. Ch1-1]MDP4520861.1 roadblock/LC7 domain-containing protein [Methylomarinum sp. Ch1-1]